MRQRQKNFYLWVFYENQRICRTVSWNHSCSFKKGDVRAIDIVHEMDFSRPTVSIAVHNLEKENLVHIDENGNISLAKKGLEIAERIYERHTILSKFLQKLGVCASNATKDACKIEHDISDETFNCIKKFVNE